MSKSAVLMGMVTIPQVLEQKPVYGGCALLPRFTVTNSYYKGLWCLSLKAGSSTLGAHPLFLKYLFILWSELRQQYDSVHNGCTLLEWIPLDFWWRVAQFVSDLTELVTGT